jgi:uncharacterized membrane protein YgcG
VIPIHAPMRLRTSFLFSIAIVIGALFASPVERAFSTAAPNQSGDPGWPRERYQNGTRLIIYQPQVDDWKDFQDLTWRMAISLTPKSGKEVVGVVEMKGNTDVDNVGGFDRSGGRGFGGGRFGGGGFRGRR